MSLARGLDYYTGIIYEAIVEASAPPALSANATESPAPAPPKTEPSKKAKADDNEEDGVDESQVGVGSIAAGGRYDNLVGMFTAAAAAEGRRLQGSLGREEDASKETMVYVLAAGDGLLEERIALVQELREAGIKTDFLAKRKLKLTAQFMAGEKDEVPLL
ncbi:hypothetical protein BDR07DRAFT_1486501 [Suillus spraguei]|nr:hypothetical protein BDR07DRAFT_1486501 [Suillus spraguei]